MIVTYCPADGDPRRWEFDPDRVRAQQAELIERRFGGDYEQWVTKVQAGSVRARRVLLWHLLRLEHHTLKFDDTPDFAFAELRVELTRAELAALIDRVRASGLPADEKDSLVADLLAEMPDDDSDDADAPAGKGGSSGSAETTG